MAHTALVGTGTQTASSLTGTITVSSAVPAGQTVLGGVCWESAAGSIPAGISVSDTRGNSWTVDSSAGGASNVTDAIAHFRTRVTTGIQVGDAITIAITTATRNRWAMQADAFDDINTTPVDQTATPVNNASSTSMAAGPTGALAQAYELAYAVFGFNAARTATVSAPWSATGQVNTAAGSNDRAVQCEYQYTASTSALSSAASLNTSSVYCATLVTYKATAPVTKNPQLISQYGGYF